jgi:small subunit ribosomal protein S21
MVTCKIRILAATGPLKICNLFAFLEIIFVYLPLLKTERPKMLVVQIKEGDNIEKALKKYKKKFEKTGVVKQLRERSKFTKPSVRRREEVIKASYKQKLQIGAIEK